MDEADRTLAFDHQQNGSLQGIEDLQCFTAKLIGAHRIRAPTHDVFNEGFEKVRTHVAAQVAVSDDADQIAGPIDDADAAPTLCGHFHDRVRHPSSARLHA